MKPYLTQLIIYLFYAGMFYFILLWGNKPRSEDINVIAGMLLIASAVHTIIVGILCACKIISKQNLSAIMLYAIVGWFLLIILSRLKK